MIDVVRVGDRVDGYVILDRVAGCGFDRNRPFPALRAHQHDFARLFVVYHQRVRICDHVYRWGLAGADVVDYVTLTRIQGERHFRDPAIGREQHVGAKHEHADGSNQPRKHSTSTFKFHLLYLPFFAAHGTSIVRGVGM